MCVQRVLEEGGNEDENDIGSFTFDGQSISFKLALNTLIKNKIILEYDDEE